MERKISFDDLKKAVDEAYELNKSISGGASDPRVPAVKANTFGISVMLTDGRTVDKADTDIPAALGNIARVPVSVALFSQTSPDKLLANVRCGCGCGCKDVKGLKHKVPFSLKTLRAISAVEPHNDPEGKYGIIYNQLASMTTGEALLSDALLETLKAQADSSKALDKIAEAGFALYDDPAISLNAYLRLEALQLTTKQLAALGATIAADGRNPLTGEYAFDGTLATPVVTLMATGKHKRPWLMTVGLPVAKSFSGALLAVLPGFGAIAVYSPEVDERGLSVKGAKAIAHIAKKLGLNVFASARVSVDK